MTKLNLGCGSDIRDENEWDNYDCNPLSKRVIKIDLEIENLPHVDSSIEEIAAIDFLEHIVNLKHVLNECHRVLKSDGELYIEVPRFPHEDSVKDPTHVRFFVPETFKYISDYERACDMYGFKRWEITYLFTAENRIKVKLRPIK